MERSSPHLRSLTKERPKPPSFRRAPSRERSPRHTPRASTGGGVERVGGITSTYTQQEKEEEKEEKEVKGEKEEKFTYDVANRMLASARPIVTAEVCAYPVFPTQR